MTDLLTHRHGDHVHAHVHAGTHRHLLRRRPSTVAEAADRPATHHNHQHGHGQGHRPRNHDRDLAHHADLVANGPPAAPQRVSVPGRVLALVGLAATAGLIHLVATIEHVSDDWPLGVFFALIGTGQLFAARWIYRKPDDQRMLKAIAAGSIAIALLWLFSRTTGVPFGPNAGNVSPVGAADTIATLQELALAAIVVATIRQPEKGIPRLAWLNSGLGTRLTSAVLTASLFIAAIGGHEH